jgi:nitric-oxide synthase
MKTPRTWHRDRQDRAAALASPQAVDVGAAEDFIRHFYAENPGERGGEARLAQVREAISRTGTYTHTETELTWAVRAAWRHAARCSGRDKWRTLRVRDRRSLSSPQEVAAETVAHLTEATDGGHVRSFITVFAPDLPGRPGPRILSSQAVRYAGYRHGAAVTGDPANAGLTELAAALGWEGSGGQFDILPLVVADGAGVPHVFDVPGSAVLEIPISHPNFEWFAALGLRWYAVPVITDMDLEAGGLRYPCAPFNGWYQASSEVGVRNLGDAGRYNMLPAVAQGMGLDTSSLSTLWPDRAAVELAVAVHHSYRAAGVMVTDHQSEMVRFARFTEVEQISGRPWCADWAWIVPPVGGSTTPAFHRAYPQAVLRPGFFHRPDPVPAALARVRQQAPAAAPVRATVPV